MPPGLKRDSDHLVDTNLGPGTLWSIEIDEARGGIQARLY